MTDPAVLLHALAFAAERHRTQIRKGVDASPYINHPIAVAALLAEAGEVTDEALLVAAVLHDTVEDTKTTFAELETRFGTDVAGLVREVTDDKSLRKEVRKQLQVEHAETLSARAKQLKLADKTCNVRDVASTPPADWSRERRLDYVEWAAAVVAKCRGVNAGLEQAFDAAVGEAGRAI